MSNYKVIIEIHADVTVQKADGTTKFVRSWAGTREVVLPLAPRKGMLIKGLIPVEIADPGSYQALDSREEWDRWMRQNWHLCWCGDPEEESEQDGWLMDAQPVWNIQTERFEWGCWSFTVCAPVGTTTKDIQARLPEWNWVPMVDEE